MMSCSQRALAFSELMDRKTKLVFLESSLLLLMSFLTHLKQEKLNFLVIDMTDRVIDIHKSLCKSINASVYGRRRGESLVWCSQFVFAAFSDYVHVKLGANLADRLSVIAP